MPRGAVMLPTTAAMVPTNSTAPGTVTTISSRPVIKSKVLTTRTDTNRTRIANGHSKAPSAQEWFCNSVNSRLKPHSTLFRSLLAEEPRSPP